MPSCNVVRARSAAARERSRAISATLPDRAGQQQPLCAVRSYGEDVWHRMTPEGSTELVPTRHSRRSTLTVVTGAAFLTARTAAVSARVVLSPARVVARAGWRSPLAGPFRVRLESLVNAFEDVGRREEQRLVRAL